MQAATQSRSWLAHALVACVWLALVWWLSPPAHNDLAGGDEGYYGVMARNVLASHAQWAMPSLSPLGAPGDKPPLYPLLIAGAIRALGATATAVRLPGLLVAALLLFASAQLAQHLFGRFAGFAALAILATLPWLADAARVAQAELPLTAFGMSALALLAPERVRRRAAFAAGLLLGAAFLCKLWLVAIPASVACVRCVRPRGGALFAALTGGAAAMLATWGVAIALVAPEAFAHVTRIVFGFSLAGRASGAGFAAYWFHGPLYYVQGFARAFAAWLPLLLALPLLAWHRPPGARFAAALAALLLVWLAVLGAFRVQSGGYLMPLIPLGAVLFAALLAALAHAGGAWRRIAYVLLAAGALIGAARTAQRLPQRYRDAGLAETAAALAPFVASADPREVCLLAPEAPVFAFAEFRTARYWDSPYDPWSAARAESLRTDPRLRAFVVDTTARLYGGGPDPATLAWLESHTRELTADIAQRRGRPLGGLRVFVRSDAPAAAPGAAR